MIFNWFKKKRYHNCFTYPCAVVSKKGLILDFNNEFKSNFTADKFIPFSDTVDIYHDHNRVVSEKFGNKWELNYLQINKKEYHVVFFPYSNENFLVNIPVPLVVIGKSGNIIHFNQDFQKHFTFDLNDKNISHLFYLDFSMLKAVETANEIKIGNKIFSAKYKPSNCSTWIISLTDKSEIEEIKQKMIKSQHLQSLGQLIASISHDFNNMFTATNGFCEILNEKTKDTEIHEEIQEIIKHISSAQDLSKQLVKFVSQNDIENCNPYEVLSNLSRISEKLVEDIKIRFELDETNDHIQLSNSSLERIMINLIINSRDSIKNNGFIEINMNNNIDSIEITVKDNGCGIPKENQNKVFDAFFSTKQNGTGLGLSNIAQIVKNAKGKIRLESNENGTTISMIFPKASKVKKEEKKKTNKFNKKKNILIVEDEVGVRTVMSHALKKQGHNILEAYNGKIALEKLSEDIELMITDASLPELSGDELVREAREIFPDLKILVVSGYGEDIIKSRFGHVEYFLPKPFTISQLTDKVNEI